MSELEGSCPICNNFTLLINKTYFSKDKQNKADVYSKCENCHCNVFQEYKLVKSEVVEEC